MAFREVPVFEVREVLRLWLGGEGIRAIARLSRVDRKTVRRYVDAAIEAGVTVDGGVEQLDDLTLGRVVEIVRPHRSDGHGHAWAALVARRDTVEAWVAGGVAGVKICVMARIRLDERSGVVGDWRGELAGRAGSDRLWGGVCAVDRGLACWGFVGCRSFGAMIVQWMIVV